METGFDLSIATIVVAVVAIAIIWYKKTRKGWGSWITRSGRISQSTSSFIWNETQSSYRKPIGVTDRLRNRRMIAGLVELGFKSADL